MTELPLVTNGNIPNASLVDIQFTTCTTEACMFHTLRSAHEGTDGNFGFGLFLRATMGLVRYSPRLFREPELSTELLRSRTVTEMRNVKILEACPSFFTTQPTQNSSHNTTTGVFQRSPLNYKTNESVERF